MSDWHIHCSKCGDVIGVWPDDLCTFARRDNVHPMLPCMGKGKHQRPSERSVRLYWGIAEEFVLCYAETDTEEPAFRYIGPPWWPLLLLALSIIAKRNPHEQFKRIHVAGKVLLWLPHRWIFWRRLVGIFAPPPDGQFRNHC